jgi:hypothetical protein
MRDEARRIAANIAELPEYDWSCYYPTKEKAAGYGGLEIPSFSNDTKRSDGDDDSEDNSRSGDDGNSDDGSRNGDDGSNDDGTKLRLVPCCCPR